MRLGVVGCGFISSEVHLRALQEIATVTVAAACDVNRARADNYRSLAGLAADQMYEDYQQLISDPDVDCILIATPPASHAKLAIDALHSGKHVLCEKPIAMTRPEAEDMIREASAQQRAFGVINNFIRFPEIRKLHDIMGGLAPRRPRTVSIRGLGLGMDAEMIQAYLAPRPVTVSCDSRGGVLLDYGVHVIYVLNSLLKAVPDFVTCRTSTFQTGNESVDSSAILILDYGDCHALVELSWQPRARTEERILQRGQLSLAYDDALVDMVYAGQGEGIHAPAENITVATGAGETVYGIDPAQSQGKLRSSFTENFLEFFDHCTSVSGPHSSALSALEGMAVLEACFESARTRKTVPVTPVAADLRASAGASCRSTPRAKSINFATKRGPQ